MIIDVDRINYSHEAPEHCFTNLCKGIPHAKEYTPAEKPELFTKYQEIVIQKVESLLSN